MYRNNKFGWSALLAGAVVLSGCTSLLQGKPYRFPQPGEPSATVRLKYESGTNLDAIAYNDDTGPVTLPVIGSVLVADR
ncbi:hypothetical protein [Pseudomonas chlororaphis]|uniref:hypothetical protein n=1 Tax=Pseudomonas chlororaphis TaxID=587753 RepID=UPI001E2D6BD2|nr:hypothetical protein [Pseudomonas chlororaphis]